MPKKNQTKNKVKQRLTSSSKPLRKNVSDKKEVNSAVAITNEEALLNKKAKQHKRSTVDGRLLDGNSSEAKGNRETEGSTEGVELEASRLAANKPKESKLQGRDALSDATAIDTRKQVDQQYTLLNRACARSLHLQGKLHQQQSRLIVELPAALPSTLLLRALQKDHMQHQTLTADRLIVNEPHKELQLDVDGLSELQLHGFINELDELISEFTGRS